MSNDLAGHVIAGYRVLEEIGEGGMATVWKAYQPSLDRTVALKLLPQHLARRPGFSERFRREAKAIARLEHQNILAIYDYGQEGDLAFLVMPYIGAGTLKDLLLKGPVSFSRVSDIVSQIAAALDLAHSRGVIHRDVKPSNVLVDPSGRAFLSDFGVAKILEGEADLTGSGVSIGTPEYMSPEQGLGKQADARSDVYSLGVVLYEMLTGQRPFKADTPMGVVFKHIHDPLPLPRRLNPNIPELAEQVILKAMAKSPDDRFKSAGQMATALQQAPHSSSAEPGSAEKRSQGSDATVPRLKVPLGGASRWLIRMGTIGVALVGLFLVSRIPLQVRIVGGQIEVVPPATEATGGEEPAATSTGTPASTRAPTINPFPTSIPQELFVPGYVQGTRFVAQASGVYRFTFLAGSYSACPPGIYPACGKWQSGILVYVNRDISWASQPGSDGFYGAIDPDFIIGDSAYRDTAAEAEAAAAGSSATFPLSEGEYIWLLTPDARDAYDDNVGGMTLAVTVIAPLTRSEIGGAETSNWAITFEYRFPGGYWAVGPHTYTMGFSCVGGEADSATRSFMVSDDFPLVPGDVYLRWAGLRNSKLYGAAPVEGVNPSQSTVGLGTWDQITRSEAEWRRENCAATISWDGGAPVSLIAQAPFEHEVVLLAEDFEDGLAQLFVEDGEGWQVKTDEGGNRYWEGDNSSTLDIPLTASFGLPDWTDYSLSYRFKLIRYAGEGWPAVTSYVRWAGGTGPGYLVSFLHADNNLIVGYQPAGGGWERLQSFTFRLEIGRWYSVRVDTCGKDLRTFVDGFRYFDSEVSQAVKGTGILDVGRGTIAGFDDVIVRACGEEPSSGAPATALPQVTVELDVDSRTPWQDTGLEVSFGDTVTIEYVSGAWTTFQGVHSLVDADGNVDLGDPKNPNHPVPSAYPGVLIAKIADGIPFEIGNTGAFEAPEPGRLYLQMNDDTLADNEGALQVRVTISPVVGTAGPSIIDMECGFSDEFSGEPLDRRWQWVDPLDDSTFSLTQTPGFLRLFTPDRGHDIYVNQDAPRMLQPVSGDFTVITRVTIEPRFNYQGAGLLVWADPNNYVRLERTLVRGVNMGWRVAGRLGSIETPFSGESPVYLMLVRGRQLVTGSFSDDGLTWTPMGTTEIGELGDLQAGVALYNEWQDNPIYADFDYFRIDECIGS